jgi:hypothetical protein
VVHIHLDVHAKKTRKKKMTDRTQPLLSGVGLYESRGSLDLRSIQKDKATAAVEDFARLSQDLIKASGNLGKDIYIFFFKKLIISFQ